MYVFSGCCLWFLGVAAFWYIAVPLALGTFEQLTGLDTRIHPR